MDKKTVCGAIAILAIIGSCFTDEKIVKVFFAVIMIICLYSGFVFDKPDK